MKTFILKKSAEVKNSMHNYPACKWLIKQLIWKYATHEDSDKTAHLLRPAGVLYVHTASMKVDESSNNKKYTLALLDSYESTFNARYTSDS